jgi:predicted transposase YbfD/YdcC
MEKRTYEVFDTAEILKKWPEWKAVKRVIRVERSRERLSQRSVGETETSYYGSNRELSAKEFAQLIQEHWWCENKNHYPKDTAFNEDKTTKRVGAFNFSILISMALNIMRINKSNNIRGDIYLNTMDFDRVINMTAYL